MATTKKKKAAPRKGQSKSKAKKSTRQKPAAKSRTATAKAKKSARPKAAKSAAKSPARRQSGTARRTATARPKPARAKARRAAPLPKVKEIARPDEDGMETMESMGGSPGMEGTAGLASEGSLFDLDSDTEIDRSEAPPDQVRSTTTLLQTVDLSAPPDEVYRAYMMPARHAEFTGGAAEIDGRVGGHMTAWNGYISGEFLQLEEGRRIVQSWRTTEWPAGYGDSKLELTFTPTDQGTRITMVHSNVPAQQAHRYEDGWKSSYWEPLKKYLSWETPH